MIDYSQYTIEQLINMMAQESKQMEKLTNNGYLALLQMVRMADLTEAIGNKYIELAEKMRRGEAVEFE